ncbi:MAG: DNA mismatch repair endonuclease MutL [Flavobacteriaceae bacterium]
MADIIKLLPDHVANQIAAGEVVQRPASVVKELLENAIDAQSDTIKLIVKNGGKTLIQVVDDGIGMSGTDARLSFERHATSKINTAEDLFNLQTKGFRGEALASIAAIAHVDLQTKPEGDELGTLLRIEGSKVVAQEVTVTPKGTSISVKNLFFNIPARRNFLKSDTVELRHITDEFHRVALAHPTINFHFYNNGSEIFNLPSTSYRQRIVNIFGSKTHEMLVPLTEDTPVVKISGFVKKPQFAKRSRGEQFFFVNHRFIKSPYLHHAVLAAFEGLIRPNTYPGYFIYLEVDPASVDINIHPTKTEVKFEDEHTLYAMLRSTVKHSLGQFNVAPVLDFDRDRNLDTPYAFKDKEAVAPHVTVDSGYNPFAGEKNQGVPVKKQSLAPWESIYVGLKEQEPSQGNFSDVQFESTTITGSVFGDDSGVGEKQSTSFQLNRKYIVTTIKSGMVVIHQNRAHQRVLYEKFLKNTTKAQALSQQLLFPLQLTLSTPESAVLEELRESLISLGFVFGNMDGGAVEVTGVPLQVPESGIGTVLDQLIADHQMQVVHDGFSQSDRVAKTLARTLAVKTGEVMEPQSQWTLVNDLFACKESRLSPFNKPVFVTLAETDIDKKFD